MLTFTVYVLVDENNVITPQAVFVSIALFEVMRIPMSLLPLLIVYVIEVFKHKISIIHGLGFSVFIRNTSYKHVIICNNIKYHLLVAFSFLMHVSIGFTCDLCYICIGG